MIIKHQQHLLKRFEYFEPLIFISYSSLINHLIIGADEDLRVEMLKSLPHKGC